MYLMPESPRIQEVQISAINHYSTPGEVWGKSVKGFECRPVNTNCFMPINNTGPEP
jgi:hypothetical protein